MTRMSGFSSLLLLLAAQARAVGGGTMRLVVKNVKAGATPEVVIAWEGGETVVVDPKGRWDWTVTDLPEGTPLTVTVRGKGYRPTSAKAGAIEAGKKASFTARADYVGTGELELTGGTSA